MSVMVVIANHPDLADDARPFVRRAFHIHVGTQGVLGRGRRRQLDLRRGNVDLVVSTCYMKILDSVFPRRGALPLINIHHSFLPAFIGTAPYRRAKERGVKLVGTTAHYCPENLDERRCRSPVSCSSHTHEWKAHAKSVPSGARFYKSSASAIVPTSTPVAELIAAQGIFVFIVMGVGQPGDLPT
jgi:formyltetrahydrofolate hydrolase